MENLWLVPQPAHLDLVTEAAPFSLSGASIAVSHLAAAAEHRAAEAIQATLYRLGITAPIQPQLHCPDRRRTIILAVRGRDSEVFPTDLAAESDGDGPTQEARQAFRWAGATEAYTLLAGESGIEIWGSSEAGVARGAQTLCQVLRSSTQQRAVPALRIDDAPALPWRGVLLDVSRGRVPTLESLYRLVDVLASYKLNMLQLYVEHTFAFRRHPHIGAGEGALTPQEIVALDRYCRERCVELVPCLQSFGHLRGILALPEYAHLAESEERWSLAPVRDEVYALLDDLYADFLACFSSRYFNVCSDETYDLGTGQSKERAAEIGLGRLYLGHIQRLHALARRYGRTMLVWDDIFLRHPELTTEIPDDAILLNWWYEAADDYPQVNGFHEAGLRQVICPGTSTWNTLFPRLDTARRNISAFIAAGRRVGALGMLNTDWGDNGHFNLPGSSWYAYAYGAAEAWHPAQLTVEEFERRFAALTFGPEAPQTLQGMHLLDRACTLPGVFRGNGSRSADLFFDDPLSEDTSILLPSGEEWDELPEERRCELLLRRAGCTQITDEVLAQMRALALQAAALLAPLQGVNEEAARTLAEFRLAARQVAHAAWRGQLARRTAAVAGQDRELAGALEAMKRDLHVLRADYERLWLLRSKPEGLWKSLDRFDHAALLVDRWRTQVAAAYTWIM